MKMQQLKRLGYLISIVSVFLLAATSWAKAKDDHRLLLCLIGGVLTSIVGMTMRWVSYEMEQRQKQAEKQRERTTGSRSGEVQGKHGMAAT